MAPTPQDSSNKGGFPANRNLKATNDAKATGTRMKIGEILLQAGLIDQKKLGECLIVATKTAQPVGRVMTMLNYMAEREIESALVVQSLIANKQISRPDAIKALKEAARRRTAIIELIQVASSESFSDNAVEIDLGWLLTTSQFVSPHALEEAQALAIDSQLPLTRSLVLMNAITVSAAGKVLQALALVRSGRIAKEQAVIALSEVRRSGSSLFSALKSVRAAVPNSDSHVLLGELIAKCGLASDIEILGAVESAMIEGRKLGEVLCDYGLVTPAHLQSALEVQDFTSKGVIPIDQALLLFNKLVRDNISLAQFSLKTELLSDSSPSDKQVIEALCACNVVSEADIIASIKDKSEFRIGPIRALLATERLDPRTYRAAQDYIALLQEGRVGQIEGQKALIRCATENLTFAQAIASIGSSLTERKVEMPVEFAKNQESQKVLFSRLKRFSGTGDFLRLLILLLVTPGLAYFWYYFAQPPYDIIGVWTIAVLAGVLLMLFGFSFKQSQKDAAAEAYQQLDSAKQNLNRLSKSKHSTKTDLPSKLD